MNNMSKDIIIKITGEEKQGMSASAFLITDLFIKYYKKENKESEKRIKINEKSVIKSHREFKEAFNIGGI